MKPRARITALFSGLLLMATMIVLLACEGQTITFEESTEEADGSRTVRVSSSSNEATPAATRPPIPTPAATRPPIPTPEPGERVVFPLMSDGDALVALFDAAGSGDWGNKDGWLFEVDLSLWYGVTTNAEGRVTALDLSSIGLSGELPEDIGLLTELTELNLSNNSLSGALPAEMGDLVNLEELYLNNNRFSGALPASLGNLVNLTDLHLHGNQFGAEFPAALAALPKLESVTIWGNKFTWAESYPPGLLADLVALVALYESAGGDSWSERSNWLRDPLVASWSGVSIGGDGSVTGLALSGNRLSGELPPQLGGLTSLTHLDLSGNQLEGEIPENIGNLTGLTELSLHSNQLGGNPPAELGNLTALTHLSLYSNQLRGEIPAEIGGLSSLTRLHLNNNQLSGPIPEQLSNLADLEELNVAVNQLSGNGTAQPRQPLEP